MANFARIPLLRKLTLRTWRGIFENRILKNFSQGRIFTNLDWIREIRENWFPQKLLHLE